MKIISGPHTRGIVLKDGFDEYVSSRWRKRFCDIEGTEDLIEEFEDIHSTGFEEQLLIDIFSNSHSIED